ASPTISSGCVSFSADIADIFKRAYYKERLADNQMRLTFQTRKRNLISVGGEQMCILGGILVYVAFAACSYALVFWMLLGSPGGWGNRQN
ncbi:MAG: hypothetical protein V1856_00315, partial [Candidatus Liptonbacteria bacterium]